MPNLRTRGNGNVNNYIVDEAGCWIWRGALTTAGYGSLTFEQKRAYAHIFQYERRHGAVPDGFELDHKCRVRACCNPDHLEVVTHVENLRRGKRVRFKGPEMEEVKKILKFRPNIRKMARVYGVAYSTIQHVAAGRKWR